MALLTSDVLSSAARAAPERLAMTLGDGALTFGGLSDRSNRLANALSGWGVRRGARVAYWADMSLDAAPLQFALGRLGAAFAPLNPAYAEEEARAVLDYLAPRLLIVDPSACRTGRGPGQGARPAARHIGRPGSGHGTRRVGRPGLCRPPVGSLARRRRCLHHLSDQRQHRTSEGSDGLTAGDLVANVRRAAATVTTGGKGQLVMFPLFHMAGWTFAYHAWSAHQAAHFVDAGRCP